MISVPSSISEVSVTEMKPSVATTEVRSPEAGRLPHTSSATTRMRFPSTGMKHLVMDQSSVERSGPVASDVHLRPGYLPGLVTRAPQRSGHSRLPQQPAPGPRSSLPARSEEHTSELQSLMRISYAVFRLKKKIKTT